jgi:hypothetical protein
MFPDHIDLANDTAKAVVHVPVRVGFCGSFPVQGSARPLDVGDRYRVVQCRAGRAEVPYNLLDLHRPVVDIIGLGFAAVCRSYDTSFAQAVAAVGEGGGRAVRGADAQPVLAIPGVRAAGGVGERVAACSQRYPRYRYWVTAQRVTCADNWFIIETDRR